MDKRTKKTKLSVLLRAYISKLRDELPDLERDFEVVESAVVERTANELEYILDKRELPE